MATIPPELTSSALTALAVGGTWFASWLARKGKREDTKIAVGNQTFTQLRELAEARLDDIERLTAALAAANAEIERIRSAWEARWDRQMARCRKVTDALVRAITALRKLATPEARQEADRVLVELEEHRQDDHDQTTS